MASIFLTGFPGFLGSRLVERLLARRAHALAIKCLVQRAYRPQAEQRVRAIEAANRGYAGRIELCEGDITAPDLGLGPAYRDLAAGTTEIYHLAAVYDLGVAREPAMKINVDGTRNVLDFAGHCGRLQRLQYVSTCYVSGRHPGRFGEDDLVRGQTFNNYYEQTKYLAEVEVQERMRQGLRATIYRPAIVVGDSQTGATQKYDGIYYLARWLMKQPGIALMPVFGDGMEHEINLAPRDFVVDALAYLSAREGSEGKVYQLCDPNPPTMQEAIDIIGAATGRRVVEYRASLSFTRSLLQKWGWLRQRTGIEPATLEYFSHPTRYTCENTVADLAGSGIECPPFATYAANLISYMKAHPEVSSRAMV